MRFIMVDKAQFFKNIWILIIIMCISVMNAYAQNEEAALADMYERQAFSEPKAVGENNATSKLKTIVVLKEGQQYLVTALESIARQAGLKLSYSKQFIPLNKNVQIEEMTATAEKALWSVLEGTQFRFGISVSGQLVLMKLWEAPNERGYQQEAITGTVTDAESGEKLPGVNISVKGTTTGTSTNAEGRYDLTVSSLNDTLIFSFIGYQTQEVPINGRTELNIGLQQQALIGEEMVVTALGIERESASLGYSVSQVGGEDFTEARSINVADALTGKVAGVNATGMGTGPGSSSRVTIRGSGSLDGNNQPLYVVNGMPITNDARNVATMEGGGTSRVDLGDGISNISPDDIESISVLKGGAAAALYGSQAANGVILITTKGGTPGREGIGVEVNSNFMVGTINRYPDTQTRYGQGVGGVRPQTQDEAINTGRLEFGEKHDGQPTVNFDGQMRPYSFHSTKDQMNAFYRPSTTATNSIAFDGGNEAFVYRLSLSNLDAKSIQPNSKYSRNTANLNIKANPSDRLSIQATMQYNFEEGTNRPEHNYAPGNTNWGVTLLANSVPIEALAPGYRENGTEVPWQHVAVATNPYFAINKKGNNDARNRVLANGSITYNFSSSLYFKGDFMRDFEAWEASSFLPKGTADTPLGSYRNFNEEKSRTNARAIIGFDSPINESFSLSSMVGGNIERVKNKNFSLSGIDFVVDDWISARNLATTSSSEGVLTSGTNSLFASADLDYNEMIYLNLTGRQDWFSTLNTGNNSILYPSIGASVILSRIFQLPEIIDFAKVRASWAEVGGATVQPYAINQTYDYQEGGHLGVPVQTMSSVLPNPDLRPLTSTTTEVGFNLELLESRLNFDLTLYERINTDDMVSTDIALSSGASSTILNVGKISNKGLELLISGDPVRTSNFSWNVSYNLGYNKNEVLSLAEGQATGPTSLLGRPLSTLFVREMATTEDGTRIYNSASNYELRSEPRAQGPGVPPYTMGLSNSLRYKDFSLDLLIDAKFGNVFMSRHHRYLHRFGQTKETLPGREEGLTVRGVDENGNDFEHYWPASFMATYYNNQGNYRSLFTNDGSFIKLRSAALRYNIPVEKLGNLGLGVHSASIALVGTNIAILFSRTEHFDPEQGFDASDNTQNFAGTQLPRTRNMGVNLKIRF